MGLVKRYLSATVQRERAEIESNRKLIQSYRSDTLKKQAEVEELNTKPASFSATRCSSCSRTLDLPTVHFLCKHSFHQGCLNVPEGLDIKSDTEVECSLCASQNRIVRQTRQAQEESASKHELFTTSLQNPGDGGRFGVIGDWFGRGVMSANAQVAGEVSRRGSSIDPRR